MLVGVRLQTLYVGGRLDPEAASTVDCSDLH